MSNPCLKLGRKTLFNHILRGRKRQMILTEEEFISWREHSVTRHIFDTVLRGQITRCRDAWMGLAWDQGDLCPIKRTAYRERAALANELVTLTFADLEGTLEQRAE